MNGFAQCCELPEISPSASRSAVCRIQGVCFRSRAVQTADVKYVKEGAVEISALQLDARFTFPKVYLPCLRIRMAEESPKLLFRPSNRDRFVKHEK
jgi:hypothetical protein